MLQLKKRELELLKEKKAGEELLPHIFFPMYSWQRKLVDSLNRVNLITAANQIGKSSALIRRIISNATDPVRWEKLWGTGVKPKQFWYFYPDGLTLEKEIETKWQPEWLPRGPMESDPQYGWKLTKKNSIYSALKFRAGPTVYFQMYTKSVSNVQSSTVHEVYADEELPMEFYDELMFRLTATDGIFNSGFTPTLNQFFWKQAMETNKVLPSALKLEVSMYDCLVYEDGSPSRTMTLEKIRNAEAKCKNETEKQRRIFGKFVTESGRSYYAFEYEKNVKRPYDITGWLKYASVDYGSGKDSDVAKSGKRTKNHPAAICFIAVRPDFKKGAVFKCWRGDDVKTTAGDVFNKYIDLKDRMPIVQACYDPGAKDFGTIADRNSESFTKADKSRDAGADLLNTLFKHDMLDIFDDDPENLKLAAELMSLMITNQQSENKSDDDLCDAARYNAMQIPWDLSHVAIEREKKDEFLKVVKPMTEEEFQVQQIKLRRGESIGEDENQDQGWSELEEEFDEWNTEYGS